MIIFHLNLFFTRPIILYFTDGQKVEYDKLEQTMVKNSYENRLSDNFLYAQEQFEKNNFRYRKQKNPRNDEHIKNMFENTKLSNENLSVNVEKKIDCVIPNQKIIIKINMDRSTYLKIEQCNRNYQNVCLTAFEIYQLISSYAFSIFDESHLIIQCIYDSIFNKKTINFDMIYLEFFKSLKDNLEAKKYEDEINKVLNSSHSQELEQFKEKLRAEYDEKIIHDKLIKLFFEFEITLSDLSFLFRNDFLVVFFEDYSSTLIYCRENEMQPRHSLICNNIDFDKSELLLLFEKPCLIPIDLNGENKNYFLRLVNEIIDIQVSIDMTRFISKIVKYNAEMACDRLRMLHKIFTQIFENSHQIFIIMNNKTIIITKDQSGDILCSHQNIHETVSLHDIFFHKCMGLQNLIRKYNLMQNLDQILDLYYRKTFEDEKDGIRSIFLNLGGNDDICTFDSVEIKSKLKVILFSIVESVSIKKQQTHVQYFESKSSIQQLISGYCETREFICSCKMQFNAIVTKKFISFEMYLSAKILPFQTNARKFHIDEENGDIDLDFCLLQNFCIKNSNFKILLFNCLYVVSLDVNSSIEYNSIGFIQIKSCFVYFYDVIPFYNHILQLNQCVIYASASFRKNASVNLELKNSIRFNSCHFEKNFTLFSKYFKLSFYQCHKTCIIKGSFEEIDIIGITKMIKKENLICLFLKPNHSTKLNYNTITKHFESKFISMNNSVWNSSDIHHS